MWIVRLALSRPHTFIVVAIAIVLFGVISIKRMPVDIFPSINIPLVSCVWTYAGMSPYEMENLVTSITERSLTSTVNGVQRIESTSLSGMSIVKVYLQKGTPIGEAVAMVTSVGSAILRQLPRNITPPFVTESSATDVPVLQLGLHSKTLSEAELFDIANNFVRSQLATVQGATIPFPYGGKYRQVMVDLDPKALVATGLSPSDVIQAINDQNIVAPTGTAKFGPYEYVVDINNIPAKISDLNNIPIKTVDGAVVFVKDVGQVHDGYQPQQNIVNHNGVRSVLLNILKSGEASTLDVVQRAKEVLPRIRSIVPGACNIDILTDQSIFVRECVDEVIREALTAAGLTALMMLALLGSWRSTLIVATSIPLAILTAMIGLSVTGQTINSMTLGGLALAVGMLVDDATVAIENLHSNLAVGKGLIQAILDSSQQVALPALVSTLSICIVFVPLLLLTEPSRSLFVPLGMSVTFAMLASYFLSRTIVPMMSKYLLESEAKAHAAAHAASPSATPSPTHRAGIFSTIHTFIESGFESARDQYGRLLNWFLAHPKGGLAIFLGFYLLSLCLLPQIGEDYFPTIDAGQIRLHVGAHSGTRIEETERLFNRVEGSIRKLIPAAEVESISQNIGLPVSAINYAYSDSQTTSEADGEILISLNERQSHSTAYYEKAIRKMLRREFPQVTYYFQPADIVTQILNAGLPAPIDIRILGFHRDDNYKLAQKIRREVAQVPGAVDVVLHQSVDAPHVLWEVDRTRALQVGVTQQDINNSLNVTLSSSFQVFPNFWLNRANGINYNLAAQTPQRNVASIDDVRMTSVTRSNAFEIEDAVDPNLPTGINPQPQLLTNLATPSRQRTPAVANHLNVQPVFDIYVACQDRDLGGVSKDIKTIVDKYKKGLQRGTFMFMGGQVMSMYLAFAALIGGLVFAIVLVYLLLVVNFQSWTDPLIILMAIPGAMTGIIWSLFVTQTTFSIPALMGTIMTVGVASANSILMVSFAKEQFADGGSARAAALAAGFQRFRPVLMTATAMIVGMIPMAIGSGQGGSQNAPIGRAVIGGLMIATLSTLIFVPLIFSITRGKRSGNDRQTENTGASS